MFSRFTTDRVLWADGTKEVVAAVVFATDYRPVFGCLTGSGALDDAGGPVLRGGVSTTAKGLGFVGMEF
ncbi:MULTISPECIES: hypothetical protein [unclassified Streptomyces]|uniref:hypothetical protein n=1 Tax=unclassified Streptomyces TaxID=2593676 RepID=UPI00344B8295